MISRTEMRMIDRRFLAMIFPVRPIFGLPGAKANAV
jgi:hypothetical protein